MILDAGAGDLKYTRYLIDMGYSVIPIDIFVPKDVEDIQFKQASIENIPFEDATFDFVFCFSVLPFVENDQKAIDELYRILKTGSFCIITVPSSLSIFRLLTDLEKFFKINPYTNRLHVQYPEYDQKIHYYTNTQITNILGKKFKIVDFCGYDLNFIPRVFSFFYKLVFRREIKQKINQKNTVKIGSNRTYKNKFLCEICYHKIIVCKKVERT